MKKIFYAIIGFMKAHVALCVSAAVAIVAVGGGIAVGIAAFNRNHPAVHEHKYAIESVVATCGHGGYVLHTCDCGDSYRTDETEPLPHEYGDWKTTIEATVDNEGQKEQHCLHCNHRVIEAIPQIEVHEHIYKEKVVAPTCTQKGFTECTCTVCEYVSIDAETAALGHSWSDWKIVLVATETSTGKKTRSCQACGASEDEVIPKVIPAHNHSYVATIVEPTCAEKGYTVYVCECGDRYTADEEPPRGHLYGSWVTTVPATSTSVGEKQITCSRCGYVKTETIPQLDEATSELYEYYIDPRITIRTTGDGNRVYTYKPDAAYTVSVTDKRTWGTPPTIRITENGGFSIVYYQQNGDRVSYTLNPVEGYVNKLIIRDNGSYGTTLIGDYND